MSTSVRVGGFVARLAALFAAALGAGRTLGPDAAPTAAAHGNGAHPAAAGRPADGSGTPGGLQVAQDGYRLVPVSTALAGGAPRPFSFRVLGPDGAPVTRYTATHDRDLHLILIRRDLAGFRHVHPTLAPDGTWTVPLAVPAPGQYRVFADFQPAGRDRALTLGMDVAAPGDYRPVALPAPARTATVDGYTVTLRGDLVPGTSSRLTLAVSRNGTPVTDLQPYLGAYGHLVALRHGDLAYLHVHPDGTPGDGRTPAGPEVTFHAEVPSAGSYRLYLDFQHAGTVHTAEFTAEAGPPAPVASAQPPAAEEPAGHGGPADNHG